MVGQKETVTYAKISSKMVNPRYRAEFSAAKKKCISSHPSTLRQHASLCHCVNHNMPHCVTVSITTCLSVSLHQSQHASLCHCVNHNMPHCVTVSITTCLIASLGHCTNHNMPHWVTALITTCLIGSLHPSQQITIFINDELSRSVSITNVQATGTRNVTKRKPLRDTVIRP